MALNRRSNLIKSLIVPALVLGVLLSGCNTSATDASYESTETETSATESAAPTTSETTTETATEATTESTSDESNASSSDDESSADETSEETRRDIGYGSYGFLIGDMRFHSKNDISMMIQQEDATVYDFGAKKCDWIDVYYINTEYDMKTFDASYRFLGFFNNETSVSFDPSVEIGPWTTPKGSNLDLYVAEITIISRNLVIKLCPKYPNNPDYYNVSICGRGYYCSKDQLQMMDFFLSYLQENPGVDPLEGIIEAEDHVYYY